MAPAAAGSSALPIGPDPQWICTRRRRCFTGLHIATGFGVAGRLAITTVLEAGPVAVTVVAVVAVVALIAVLAEILLRLLLALAVALPRLFALALIGSARLGLNLGTILVALLVLIVVRAAVLLLHLLVIGLGGEHDAEIVLGELVVALRHDDVARDLGIAAQLEVFVGDGLGGAPDLHVRPVALIDPAQRIATATAAAAPPPPLLRWRLRLRFLLCPVSYRVLVAGFCSPLGSRTCVTEPVGPMLKK